MDNQFKLKDFIRKARVKHGWKFDYSKVEYKNANTKVCIICPKHGEFWQTPNNHIHQTHCCPKCWREKAGRWKLKSLDKFIEEAKAIHGDKYDYSKVQYINSQIKVCIICPIHGEFWQIPNAHIQGFGCNKCGYISSKRLVHGVGINDLDDEYLNKTKLYNIWKQMLYRCYDKKWLESRPTYIGCSVCEEWHYLSNFKKWFDENYIEGYALDKDIFSNGNKVYSPETCCFVPLQINNAIKNSKESVSKKMGVHPNHGVFEVVIGKFGKRVYCGSYNTVKDAEQAYIRAKEGYVREIGQIYYNQGRISERVYNALMNYKI